MENVIQKLTAPFLKKDIPLFRAGDTVKIYVKIKEGENERIQVFAGYVIGRKGGGINETFTVRKISAGVGVERIFSIHSPFIEKIEVVAKGKVRKAKIYYLREKVGKAARIERKQEA